MPLAEALPSMSLAELVKEAQRDLRICNACRYCEGFCAVFPAMERRRAFTTGDVVYLANLCHDCRACYYACMFAPPHELEINLPAVLAGIRASLYQRYAWPTALRGLLNAKALGIITLAGVVAVPLLTVLLGGARSFAAVHVGPGAFYQVVPYLAMMLPALVVSIYGLGALIVGGLQFARDTRGRWNELVDARAMAAAAGEALGLRWLRGGGPGCPYPEERPSYARLVLHSLVFYGFLAALVSTTLAAIYQDFLDLLPPYPPTSLPVLFGAVGGVAMIVGCAGLLYLKWRSDPAPALRKMINLDYAFILMLAVVSLTGMLTLALRETSLMGLMLTIHLGSLVALYLTLPYSKFVHFVYRYAALVQNAIEERTGGRVAVGH